MHGSLSVEKEHYAEMDNVTIQCDTGYDLVGSSNIICSENRTWYPEIPNCKTVSGPIQGTSVMSPLNRAVSPQGSVPDYDGITWHPPGCPVY